MWQTFRRLLFTDVCWRPGLPGRGVRRGEPGLRRAARLGARPPPFHSPRADLPKVLRQDNLDYDKYREIRFRRDRALWAADNLPFRVEFFHPGYLYQEPVHVNEFTPTHTQPIRFVQDFFDYGKLRHRQPDSRRRPATPVSACCIR